MSTTALRAEIKNSKAALHGSSYNGTRNKLPSGGPSGRSMTGCSSLCRPCLRQSFLLAQRPMLSCKIAGRGSTRGEWAREHYQEMRLDEHCNCRDCTTIAGMSHGEFSARQDQRRGAAVLCPRLGWSSSARCSRPNATCSRSSRKNVWPAIVSAYLANMPAIAST